MKKIYLVALLCLPLFSFSQKVIRCGTYELWEKMKKQDPSLARAEEKMNRDVAQWAVQHRNERTSSTNTVITIPVVFHVLYSNPTENISSTQIQAQIDVLNADYSKTNADTTLIPAVWQSVAANTNIQFCLAQRDPSGNASTGIERRSTTITTWNPQTNNYIKQYTNGGLDAWDRNSYCNIWVGNIGSGLLGITQFPGGAASTDGMVLLYSSLGSVANPGPAGASPYNLGRTATHEMGHWLGLYHIWGDDGGACTGTDYCADTPNQGSENYGCPTFPHTDNCTTTSPGVMFMDYMDYTDDNCMYMLTNDQSTRANGVMNTTRSSILTSLGCQAPLGINQINLKNYIDVYPNPTSSTLHIDTHFGKPTSIDIMVNDLLGNTVMKQKEELVTENNLTLNVETIANGIYTVTVRTSQSSTTQRISVQH